MDKFIEEDIKKEKMFAILNYINTVLISFLLDNHILHNQFRNFCIHETDIKYNENNYKNTRSCMTT